MTKTDTEGFAADSSEVLDAPVADGVPATGGADRSYEGMPVEPQDGDAREEGAAEGTPKDSAEDKLVPEKHLRELQSAKDRELAEARRAWEAEKFQMVQAVQAILDERDQLQFAGDETALRERRAERAAQMQQFVMAQRAQEMEKMARNLVVSQLSQKYGVKAEDIAPFSSPEDMERHALALSRQRRADNLEHRKSANVDKQEGAAKGPSNPISAITDEMELFRLGYSKKR